MGKRDGWFPHIQVHVWRVTSQRRLIVYSDKPGVATQTALYHPPKWHRWHLDKKILLYTIQRDGMTHIQSSAFTIDRHLLQVLCYSYDISRSFAWLVYSSRRRKLRVYFMGVYTMGVACPQFFFEKNGKRDPFVSPVCNGPLYIFYGAIRRLLCPNLY